MSKFQIVQEFTTCLCAEQLNAKGTIDIPGVIIFSGDFATDMKSLGALETAFRDSLASVAKEILVSKEGKATAEFTGAIWPEVIQSYQAITSDSILDENYPRVSEISALAAAILLTEATQNPELKALIDGKSFGEATELSLQYFNQVPATPETVAEATETVLDTATEEAVQAAADAVVQQVVAETATEEQQETIIAAAEANNLPASNVSEALASLASLPAFAKGLKAVLEANANQDVAFATFQMSVATARQEQAKGITEMLEVFVSAAQTLPASTTEVTTVPAVPATV